MSKFFDFAQEVLYRGIDAAKEVQVARYTPNDPRPNNRGANDVTATAGTPALDTITDTFTNPRNLLLFAVAGALLFVFVRGRG